MKGKIAFAISRIESIQRELKELKKLLTGPKKKVQIEGLWEGFVVDEKLFIAAKRSLFKGAKKELK